MIFSLKPAPISLGAGLLAANILAGQLIVALLLRWLLAGAGEQVGDITMQVGADTVFLLAVGVDRIETARRAATDLVGLAVDGQRIKIYRLLVELVILFSNIDKAVIECAQGLTLRPRDLGKDQQRATGLQHGQTLVQSLLQSRSRRVDRYRLQIAQAARKTI